MDLRINDAWESKVSALALLLLDRDEETLEVTGPEAVVVPSLDDLVEESRAVLHWLGEDLQQVSLFVVVQQDLVLLKRIDVLSHFDSHIGQVLSDVVVVGVRNAQEFDSSGRQGSHSFDDGFSLQGDMLCSCAVIVIDILLNLRFLLAHCGLIDGHFDVFMVICDDDRAEG